MKNYNTNNAIKLCSAEIAKLKRRRHELKSKLNYGVGKISLGNFDQKMGEIKNILIELQSTKNKIVALRELNKRYIKEANKSKFPSELREDKFIKFVLDREDIVNLTASLTVWLEKTNNKFNGAKTKLSILRSKMVK